MSLWTEPPRQIMSSSHSCPPGCMLNRKIQAPSMNNEFFFHHHLPPNHSKWVHHLCQCLAPSLMFGDEEEYCFNTYYVSFLVSLFDQFLGLVVVTIYDGSFLPQTKTALCSHYNVPHTSLHHRCRFVYIFCRHNPGDPFKERESPNDQGWPRGSIRWKEWAKVFEATFHPRQWTYLHFNHKHLYLYLYIHHLHHFPAGLQYLFHCACNINLRNVGQSIWIEQWTAECDGTRTGTFSGTKFFWYRYRYFFPGPNFSCTRIFSGTNFFRYFFPVQVAVPSKKGRLPDTVTKPVPYGTFLSA